MKRIHASLPLILALLLAACDGTGTPPPDETPAVHQLDLSGKVLDWPTGKTTVLEARQERDTGALLGTGTITADGNFEVTVSPPKTFRRYADIYFECERRLIYTIELSNPDVGLARLLPTLPLAEAYTNINPRDHADALKRFVRFYYVDTPLTISGRIRCGDIPGYVFTGIYEDTRFNAGWNAVVQTPTFAADGELLEVRYEAFPPSQIPDGIGWYLGGYAYAK